MICCFTIKKFWGMSLPTAGVVIGWVGTIINLILCGIFIKLNSFEEYVTRNLQDDYKMIPVLQSAFSAGNSLLLILALLDLISSICLIIGTVKKSHLLLLPWLINSGIALAIKLFLGFGLLAHVSDHETGGSLFSAYLTILTILGIYCWIWNAVFSLFKSIQKGPEQIMPDEVVLIGREETQGYKLFHNTEPEI